MSKTISRQRLYAMGEPFGDCATARKPCGGYICGFGGGGGSSSSSQRTDNSDKRNAVQDGAAISGDNSAITINTTDAGIVARALDSVDKADAIQGQGFAQLLDTQKTGFGTLVSAQSSGFDKLLQAAANVFTTSNAAVADAYRTATTEKGGTIDNKTLIALAAAAAVAAFATRKG